MKILLRHITCSDAEDYCFKQYGVTLPKKLEKVQQEWLDKLEETVMEEKEVEAIMKAKTDAGITDLIPKPGDKIEVTEVVEIPKVKLTQAQMKQRVIDWVEKIKDDQKKFDIKYGYGDESARYDSLYKIEVVPAKDRTNGARAFKFLFDGELYEYIEYHRSDGLHKEYGEAFDALTEGTNWIQESECPGVEYFVKEI